jgi:hypothetical protein
MTDARMRRYGALRAGMVRARRLARRRWADVMYGPVPLRGPLPGQAYERIDRLETAALRLWRVARSG